MSQNLYPLSAVNIGFDSTLSLEFGLVPGVAIDTKFGHNDDIGTTIETVWAYGGMKVPLAAASQLKVSSTSTEDASGGTGALTMDIVGLDSNYDAVTETVTLTGQTQVTTTTSFIAVNRMTIRSPADQPNVGQVFAYTGTATAGVPDDTTTVQAWIDANEGQTEICFLTTARNTTTYVNSYFASSNKGSGGGTVYVTVYIEVRDFGRAWRNIRRFTLANNSVVVPTIITVPEKSDIRFTAVASSGTVDVSAQFTYVTVTT